MIWSVGNAGSTHEQRNVGVILVIATFMGPIFAVWIPRGARRGTKGKPALLYFPHPDGDAEDCDVAGAGRCPEFGRDGVSWRAERAVRVCRLCQPSLHRMPTRQTGMRCARTTSPELLHHMSVEMRMPLSEASDQERRLLSARVDRQERDRAISARRGDEQEFDPHAHRRYSSTAGRDGRAAGSGPYLRASVSDRPGF